MRLNKFLTKAGACSRRKAEQLISEGRVTVNGKNAQRYHCGGCRRSCKSGRSKCNTQGSHNYETYFYKPRGVVCASSSKERPNLKDCLPLEGHFFR